MFTTRFLQVLLLSSLAVAWVELDPAIIPALDEPLEVYSLGDPSFLPYEWLEGIVGNVAHGVKFTRRQDGSSESRDYAYNGEEPVGFVDRSTGETQVYADYEKLPAASGTIDINNAFNNLVLPDDDTHTELVQGSSLVGSTANDITDDDLSKRWNDEEPDSVFLTNAIFQRWIECGGKKFPVCGPGSRARFGVGAGNKVFSLSYRWKPAKKSGKMVKANPAKVAQDIKKALEGKGRVKVKHVDTCYYDSGAQYIQPVYRVLAEGLPEDNDHNATESSDILRFFPIGDEPVENLLSGGAVASSGAQPGHVDPKNNQHTEVARSLKPNYFEARASLYERVAKPFITVGRYITDNDIHQDEFLANADGFWSNLASSTAIEFADAQYYFAPSWMYGKDSPSYVNSVNLALTEAHGWKHLFSTSQGSPAISPVVIPDTIPVEGYGRISNNHGRLAYWIIDAGEVIPAPIDFPSDPAARRRAFEPWQRVFRGGMHAVMGWRTKNLFEDNVAADTARGIAANRPVAAAWLDAADNDWVYASWPVFEWPPYGRAAVIFPCGRGSDRVSALGGLGKPTCLRMRYWDN
ncbi:hypothetical protein EST38_g10456 [Candolleomyces aberdarensis]|uniref:Uncharacterized protein n=1 Tax=Candolleomyces aberdarensis TaxID=2316362 RepID=A0A4Q2D8X9_9AGAR|nr:hypothetical protein EST38_g10456 [Candolleomyces aberdarensis]